MTKHNTRKTLLTLFLMPILFMIGPTFIQANAQSASSNSATGTVTIGSTCGIAFPNGPGIAYPTLVPGQTFPIIGIPFPEAPVLAVQNSGNVPAVIEVNGTDWSIPPSFPPINPAIIDHDLTRFNTTAPFTDYFQADAVSLPDGVFTPAATLNLALPGQAVQGVGFGLSATLNDPGFAGTLEQTVQFTAIC